MRTVESDADWAALLKLVRADHAEGKRTSGRDVPPEVSEGMVAGYRAKSPAYRFHLAMLDGAPVAYGAYAAAPNGAGMIEDLFTLQAARRKGIATGLPPDLPRRARTRTGEAPLRATRLPPSDARTLLGARTADLDR
jgi:GNAT superfamily N-acetyltransferase